MEGSPSIDAANAVVSLLLERAKWLGARAADQLGGSEAPQYSYTDEGRGGEEAVECSMADMRSVRELQFWVSAAGLPHAQRIQ